MRPGVAGPGLLVLLLLACLSMPAEAQNHPELDWQVIDTEHFRILYHQGLEGAGTRAAVIAEAAYGPITRLYGYEPSGKVRVILKDYDDYANGAAFYYQDTIEIWTTALEHDFELRGTSDWLRNVITHEFTHIISLGAARKAPQRMPAAYLQYFGYQREKNRPDILTGYPDVIASYPVMMTVVPMWFAEGVAQYMAPGAHHDRWDSHRDMILRVGVEQGTALSFDEMGVFDKCGFGNEYVYDHGYGLVLYIARTYGDVKLAELTRAAANWRGMAFDRAVEQVLGISVDRLYRDWVAAMKQEHQAQLARLGALVEGELVTDRGFSNLRPALSPDGTRLAYLSTRDQQFGPHLLIRRELSTGEEKVLTAGVTSVSWSPDGRALYFVRIDRADSFGSRQADLYRFDLEAPESGLTSAILWAVPSAMSGYAPADPRVTRLTHGLRALYPACSPDGCWLAFVRNQGTSNNLGLLHLSTGQIHYLTDFADGTQLYTPQWSPDGTRLVLSLTRDGQRDLALMTVSLPADNDSLAVTPAGSGTIELLVASSGTDRDPVWTHDGREIVFASDADSIFNLYAIDVTERRVRRLTNVVGGALSPTIDPQGQVCFSAFGAKGYEIRRIGLTGAAFPAPAFSGSATGSMPVVSRAEAPASAAPVSRPYAIDFLKTAVMPRLMIDEGRFKGGVYLQSGDALGRQNVFVGLAAAPANGDRDLFAIYEYRGWRPTLFLEAYHQKRGSSRADSSEARDLIVTGVDYNLFRLAIGGRGRLGRYGELEVSAAHDRYDASVHSAAFVPRSDGGYGFERRTQKPYGYTYLKGLDLGLAWRLEKLERRRDREINPRGRQLEIRYDRFLNYFVEGFDQSANFIDEEYLRLFYGQWSVDWREHIGLPRSSALSLRFFGGWIDSDKVDDPERVNDFFDFHVGGLEYLRGYTFYSLEGRKAVMGSAALRLPLVEDWGARFLQLYLDKAHAALYAEAGKAWDRRWDDPDPLYGRKAPVRDVGGQLRLDLISWYSVPTRVQADLAYGLDELADRSPWKAYLTVLFGYM